MASIKEAFDSTLKEAFAGIKIMLWAIPISIGLSSIIFSGAIGSIFGCTLAGIFTFLYFGLCVTVAHNVIIKNQIVVPGLNFVEMIVNGAMALLAMLPYAVIGFAVGYTSIYIDIADHPVMTLTLKQLVYLAGAAFPITALVIFVRRLNILEAFNLKKYFSGLWETFLSYTLFSIRFAFVAVVITGFIFYLFYLFIGFQNAFWVYLIVLLAVTYKLLLFNAIAQISDDIYTFPEKEEEKRRQDARIKELIDNHQ